MAYIVASMRLGGRVYGNMVRLVIVGDGWLCQWSSYLCTFMLRRRYTQNKIIDVKINLVAIKQAGNDHK